MRLIPIVAVLGLGIAPLPALAQNTPAAGARATAPDTTTKLPLKPARKVTFTTDEATWVSLDVAPDGKGIVFDLLGDLYLLPIAGGEAKRLHQRNGVGLHAALFAGRQSASRSSPTGAAATTSG